MLENDFLNQLARRFKPRPPVSLGIGDDGAILQLPPNTQLTVVTDLLLDGVHFKLPQINPALAGRKAVAVNLSDLAAMAATPVAAFISLALPKNLSIHNPSWIHHLYDGIQELADSWQFTVAGGDTNAWDGPFAINVCLLGLPMTPRSPLRSDAKPGDLICVTGPLGGSLQQERHLRFIPRFDAARWLVNHVQLHALMDLSDGLAADLPRMMQASHTGAVLFASQIPIHPDVPNHLTPRQRLAAALNDGEDFELLFTIPADQEPLLEHADPSLKFSVIGRVTHQHGIQLQSATGTLEPLPPGGWQHQL